MTERIFINYRRDDDPGTVGRLFDRLEREFGRSEIFMDVEGSIRAGDDFVDVLRAQVEKCDVLLAVIGPRWLTARDDEGRIRLENPNDWVRVEIVSALQAGKTKKVIPVLTGNTGMPRAGELPAEMAGLARRQYVRVSQERFHADATHLVNQIKAALADISALRAALEAEKLQAEQLERQRKEATLREATAQRTETPADPSQSQAKSEDLDILQAPDAPDHAAGNGHSEDVEALRQWSMLVRAFDDGRLGADIDRFLLANPSFSERDDTKRIKRIELRAALAAIVLAIAAASGFYYVWDSELSFFGYPAFFSAVVASVIVYILLFASHSIFSLHARYRWAVIFSAVGGAILVLMFWLLSELPEFWRELWRWIWTLINDVTVSLGLADPLP